MTNSPPPMTIVEALRLIRGGEPSKLTAEQARRLQGVLEKNPALHVLVGDERLVQAFRKELDRRCGGESSESESDESAPVAGRGGRRILIPAAALLALAGGAWWLLSDIPPETRTDRAAEVAARIEPAPGSSPPATVESVKPIVPPVSPVVSPAAQPDTAAKNAPVAGAPGIAEKPAGPLEAAVKPAGEAKADDDEPLMEVLRGGARLDPDGKGGWRLSSLNGEASVKLSGKTKCLEIGNINGGILLDASELEAAEIDIRGRINGSGTVKLNAPDGIVRFHGSIGGSTTVEVFAGGGSVQFLSTETSPARVEGGTRVNVTAKEVNFAAGMDGGSKADVTVTRGGSLSYATIGGGARLHYRKAAADNDPVVLHEGMLSGGGKVTSD